MQRGKRKGKESRAWNKQIKRKAERERERHWRRRHRRSEVLINEFTKARAYAGTRRGRAAVCGGGGVKSNISNRLSTHTRRTHKRWRSEPSHRTINHTRLLLQSQRNTFLPEKVSNVKRGREYGRRGGSLPDNAEAGCVSVTQGPLASARKSSGFFCFAQVVTHPTAREPNLWTSESLGWFL